MKQFYETIRGLKRKVKITKIISVCVIVLLSLICLGALVGMIINTFMDILGDEYRYAIIGILVGLFSILVFAIAIILMINERVTSKMQNYMFDYIAKIEESDMSSVPIKEIRKNMAKKGHSSTRFVIRRYRTTVKHKYGYMAEADLLNFGYEGTRPRVKKVMGGANFIIDIKTKHNFIFLRKENNKKFYPPYANPVKYEFMGGHLYVCKGEKNLAMIEKQIESLSSFLHGKNFFVEFYYNTVFLTIEDSFFFKIDEKKSIHEYKENFNKFSLYLDELYNQLQFIYDMKNEYNLN